MDIKKCKVEKNCEWSAAVVKGLAVTLGMSAFMSLDGCASKVTKTNDNWPKSIPPSSSLSEQSSSSISSSSKSSSSNADSAISTSSSVDSRNDQTKFLDVDFDPVNIDSVDIREYLDNSFDRGIVEMYDGEN